MSEEQIDLLDWLAAHPPGAPDAMTPASEDATGTEGMAPVLLTRADPACNMHRFYGLELAISLFGECGVVRHWGRTGTSGRTRTDWFTEPQEAETAFQILLHAKRRRGYAP